jgi:predicted DsbA family dithiol-disulfide isomerase
MTSVEAVYYTDPADPWSWAMQPRLDRVVEELGKRLRWRYVMAGRWREFGEPEAMAAMWEEAAKAADLEVDTALWLEAPPASSYPACLAVKAATEQGDPGPYLRALREGFATRIRKLDYTEALVEEARAVGLDAKRFRIDLASNAIVELFAADLDRAAAVDPTHHDPQTGRVRIPSVEYISEDGSVHGVYGFQGLGSHLERARAALG